MAPAATIRWFAVMSVLMSFLLLSPSMAIYCDEDDCYDLLGVSQSANSSEIKKAYYKLSLKHHPDKNPDPESKKIFVKIANAYEILKDEATREQYDYAIAHPEEVFYNTARYYQAYYGHKTDPRAVLVGLLLVLSGFQYLNQWTRYNQAVEMVKKTPAYKNRLRALELERSGGTTNKKKTHKLTNKYNPVKSSLRVNNKISWMSFSRLDDVSINVDTSSFQTLYSASFLGLFFGKMEEDFSKDLDLQIKGAEKPSIWGLLGVRFLLLPYTIGKLLLWSGCWFWRYKVKKAPYSWEDASYLTQRSLGVPHDAWINIDDSTKEDLVQRRLWEKSNLESYLSEMRKESKRRR